MWAPLTTLLADGRVLRVMIDRESSRVTYAQVLQLWRDDASFRAAFIALLADAPFSAFRWETPPITTSTADRPFEFVLLDSPGLARTTDLHAFAQHLGGTGTEGVVEFSNLGKDAIMVAPCPIAAPDAYGHLAAFVRKAPEAQKHALWKLVSSAMRRRLGAKPVWLSTAGGGVPWLHVRLDDRPKYYGYEPYREAAQQGDASDNAVRRC
ncbi:MAG: hypothetical protein OEL91_08855 [Burkholderiaceae bacterium]|nr:hypothetical protein [Burkholderiaceae bacterium]